MPLIYRVIYEENGKPQVGDLGSRLGVRPEDIDVDADGFVYPGTGGMSVAPHWRVLPVSFLPKRMRDRVFAARRSNSYRVWKMGEGAFISEKLTEYLTLRVDPERPDEHGFVEPAFKMLWTEFQGHLAATQDRWEDGET